MAKLSWALALVLIVNAGCFGPSGFRQTNIGGSIDDTENVLVNMQINLERSFVRSNSGLGAGAVVMYAAIGPFARNVIMLYGDIKKDDNVVSTFSKRMVWGQNQLTCRAPKNSIIQLRLRTGGTRTGMIDIGFVRIGNQPSQNVTVRMDETGTYIR